MTKRCLKKTIGKASLNFIELYTVLTEVEAVLNSRPLTYPYVEINDDPPLTPSHFLCGHRLLMLPDSDGRSREIDPEYSTTETIARDLSKRAKYHEQVVQAFWRRWKQEYLTGLREQHSKLRRSPGKTAAVSIGDVVLIHDSTPRNQWRMGVVIKLHTGIDGLIRSASLRVSNRRELARPIEKLYPLEIRDEDNKDDVTEVEEHNRPVRLAAIKAKQRMKEQLQCGI